MRTGAWSRTRSPRHTTIWLLTHAIAGDLDSANSELAKVGVSVRRPGLSRGRNQQGAHVLPPDLGVSGGRQPRARRQVSSPRCVGSPKRPDSTCGDWLPSLTRDRQSHVRTAGQRRRLDAIGQGREDRPPGRRVAHAQPEDLSDVPRRGDRSSADGCGPAREGARPIGFCPAPCRGDGDAVRGRRTDAPARAHLLRTAATPCRARTMRWHCPDARVRRCSNCVVCWIISICTESGDRAGLAAVVGPAPGDGACWPELGRAERILS